jgi:hypothetical protein
MIRKRRLLAESSVQFMFCLELREIKLKNRNKNIKKIDFCEKSISINIQTKY